MNAFEIWKRCIGIARKNGWKHRAIDVGECGQLFIDGDIIRFYISKYKCWFVENIYDLMFNDRYTFSEYLFGSAYKDNLCCIVRHRIHPTEYLNEWLNQAKEIAKP